MRATPAMIMLTLLTVVIIGGSWFVQRDGAASSAGAAAVADDDETVEPMRDAPQLTLPDPLPTTTIEMPILAYERVAVVTGDEEPDLRARTVEAQEFQLQLEWLRANGYETVTLRQVFAALMEDGDLPDKPILLTFLGGYRGTASVAAPRMADAEMTGVICAVTDSLPRRRAAAPDRLTWGMLRELEARGWDVASQSTTERPLTELNEAEAFDALAASQQKLERILAHPVQWLCYPDGKADPAVAELAFAAGYVLGIADGTGSTQAASAPLLLQRITIDNATGVRDLATALGG